jgi:uncharacterized hydrophobic protein (TIGR00341 family)
VRLVQLTLPPDDGESVLGVLDDEGVDYVVIEGEDETIAQFPLPAQAVEPILDDLRSKGLEDRYVVVTSAESVTSEHFEDLEERYVTGGEGDDSIQPEELAAKARDMSPNTAAYYALTLLSAVVALSGLLLDSSAIVVGSMVIAPQVGSSLSAATGIVTADNDMIRNGLQAQVVGLGAAAVGAAVAGWLLQWLGFVPTTLDVTTVSQISQRITPGVLSTLVGLAAGAAGALSLATAIPVSMVGVAVAAALIPAAATVGIGIAWGEPLVALAAAILLVSNFAAINVVAPGVLWVLDYRPEDWGDASRRRYARVGMVVVVLLAVFAGSIALTADQMTFERDASRAVVETLDSDEYAELNLVGVRATTPLVDGGYGVTVVVERPADSPYPGLATAFERAIAERTGRSVPVAVEFVEQDRTRP